MRDSLNLEDLQAYALEKKQLEKYKIPREFGAVFAIVIILASRYVSYSFLVLAALSAGLLLVGVNGILRAKRVLPPFFRARKILAEILPDNQIHRIVYNSVRTHIVLLLLTFVMLLPSFVPSLIEGISSLQVITTLPITILGLIWLGWRTIINWQTLQSHDKQETLHFYQFEFIRIAISISVVLLGIYFDRFFAFVLAGLLIYYLLSGSIRWRIANWILNRWIWKELEHTGNHDRALNKLRATRRYIPHQNLWDEANAAVLLYAGRYFEAQQAYLDALIKRQQEEPNLLSFMLGRIASCQEMQGKYDDALRHWEAAIEIEPNNYLRYGDLAEFYLYQQIEHERALELMEFENQHLKQIPATTYALYSWVLAANGRNNEAQAQIQLIPASLDNVVERQYIYYCLGWTHYYLGSRESAKASFDKAITMTPHAKLYADKAKQSVEQLQLS
jgi:tetratricopeptide (TPR) repeat protein